MDWRGACTLYSVHLSVFVKVKGDKCECSNSIATSVFILVGKLYGRVLIKRDRARTECAVGEEQCDLGRVEGSWTKCLL